MSSPTVLNTGSLGPGRFVWSAVVGEGSSSLSLSVADCPTGCKRQGGRETGRVRKGGGGGAKDAEMPGCCRINRRKLPVWFDFPI